MKAILKTLLFILTMVLLCQCKKDPEPVLEVTIPDNNFLNVLIELGVDTNGDGIISPAEAELILSLDVRGDSISDMTGIEEFVNLDTLNCNHNQLTTLDVSNNTALTYLKCYGNQLTTLDVSNNTSLTYLNCGDNQLTTLDVSNNTALISLSCTHNQLTTLDVSNNTALKNLSVGDSRHGAFGNLLTVLDVSNNTALLYLYCYSNQLTRIGRCKPSTNKNRKRKISSETNDSRTSIWNYKKKLGLRLCPCKRAKEGRW